MFEKRMADYHHKRKSITMLLSFLLLSCSPLTADVNENFNSPIFQIFTDFCLPLTNSSDGYKDENIKKFAGIANLQEGKLREGTVGYFSPKAIYHYGDSDVGAEIIVRRPRRPKARNSCSISSTDIDNPPSTAEFTLWLQGLDSGWLFLQENSHNFQVENKLDIYSTLTDFCKPLSENTSLKLTYRITEDLSLPTNIKKASLALSRTRKSCSELLDVNIYPDPNRN